jgi:creatinine amidohydrolase
VPTRALAAASAAGVSRGRAVGQRVAQRPADEQRAQLAVAGLLLAVRPEREDQRRRGREPEQRERDPRAEAAQPRQLPPPAHAAERAVGHRGQRPENAGDEQVEQGQQRAAGREHAEGPERHLRVRARRGRRERQHPVAVDLVAIAHPAHRRQRRRQPERGIGRHALRGARAGCRPVAVDEVERVGRLAVGVGGLPEQRRDRVVGEQPRPRKQRDRQRPAAGHAHRDHRGGPDVGPHRAHGRHPVAARAGDDVGERCRVDPPLHGRHARGEPVGGREAGDAFRVPERERHRVAARGERRARVDAQQRRPAWIHERERPGARAVDERVAEPLHEAQRLGIRRHEPPHVALGRLDAPARGGAPHHGRATEPRHRGGGDEQPAAAARERERHDRRRPHERVPRRPPGRRAPQQRPGERRSGRHGGRQCRREPAAGAEHATPGHRGGREQRGGDHEQRQLPRDPEPDGGPAGGRPDPARQLAQQVGRTHGERDHEAQRTTARRDAHPRPQRREQAEQHEQAGERERADARRELPAHGRVVHGRIEGAAGVGEPVERCDRERRRRHEQRAEPPPEHGPGPGGRRARRAPPHRRDPDERHDEDGGRRLAPALVDGALARLGRPRDHRSRPERADHGGHRIAGRCGRRRRRVQRADGRVGELAHPVVAGDPPVQRRGHQVARRVGVHERRRHRAPRPGPRVGVQHHVERAPADGDARRRRERVGAQPPHAGPRDEAVVVEEGDRLLRTLGRDRRGRAPQRGERFRRRPRTPRPGVEGAGGKRLRAPRRQGGGPRQRLGRPGGVRRGRRAIGRHLAQEALRRGRGHRERERGERERAGPRACPSRAGPPRRGGRGPRGRDDRREVQYARRTQPDGGREHRGGRGRRRGHRRAVPTGRSFLLRRRLDRPVLRLGHQLDVTIQPDAPPPPTPVRSGAPRRVHELTPAEVGAALRADPRLIVPVGALDAHGPHLPLGTDTLVADRLADDLSAVSGVLRAPAVTYGVNAVVPRPAPGAAALRKKTLHRLLNDLLNAWEDGGVDEFILLTTHQQDAHQEALATVVTTRARVRVVDVLGVDVSDLLAGQDGPMHADEVDTSLVLHLAPALVRPGAVGDNMPPREVLRRFRAGRRPARGSAPEAAPVYGRPSLASAETGARIYARLLERVATRVLGVAATPAAGSTPTAAGLAVGR